MDLLESIKNRRSCRAFLPQDVDKNILEEVIQAANRSPSFMNTQPWEVFVVKGEKKNELARKLLNHASLDESKAPDIPFPGKWPASLQERATAHRMNRFQALGIDPEVDSGKIREGFLRNFKFFDAPCVAFVGMEKSFSPWSVFDIGSFVHGFLLALHAKGLEGVPQAMAVSYPDIIRRELEISNDMFIVIAVALGYPDWEAPVNQYTSGRREMDTFVRWYGF